MILGSRCRTDLSSIPRRTVIKRWRLRRRCCESFFQSAVERHPQNHSRFRGCVAGDLSRKAAHLFQQTLPLFFIRWCLEHTNFQSCWNPDIQDKTVNGAQYSIIFACLFQTAPVRAAKKRRFSFPERPSDVHHICKRGLCCNMFFSRRCPNKTSKGLMLAALANVGMKELFHVLLAHVSLRVRHCVRGVDPVLPFSRRCGHAVA